MYYIKRSQVFVLVLGSIFVYLLFTFWPSKTFTTNSQLYYNSEGKLKRGSDTLENDSELSAQHQHSTKIENSVPETDNINVIITFTKAKDNKGLQDKFRVTVNSMFRWASVPLSLYIIGDDHSKEVADHIIASAALKYNRTYKMVQLDIDQLAKKLHLLVKDMQPYFSYKAGQSYYGDALFFLSIGLHQVMPAAVSKVIMLDADLKFNADIKLLYEEFFKFSSQNILGIARENQPVYRHILSLYRSKHKGTRVGDPPPNGLTGFNSGVLLLDLAKMRMSQMYNSLISEEAVKSLTTKFSFQGHLGDQDFFSLISMDHEELFYILPCSWNRQLCEWWQDKGYQDVFDLYFQCQGHINIYHGNCNTPIPALDWEKG